MSRRTRESVIDGEGSTRRRLRASARWQLDDLGHTGAFTHQERQSSTKMRIVRDDVPNKVQAIMKDLGFTDRRIFFTDCRVHFLAGWGWNMY